MTGNVKTKLNETGSKDPDYRVTLYLDTPKMFLKPGLDNAYGRKMMGGITETTWYTGHAFIGLSEGGKEEKWGFGPDHSVVDSLMVYMTGCKSVFQREDDTHFNEAIVYPISKEQYLSAQQKVREYKDHPELSYKLFSRNCSTVASSILKAAGVSAPGKLVGLTPHTLTLNKRLLYLRRKIELQMVRAKAKLLRLFGNKKASPRAAMLNVLRKKPLPVPVELGTAMGNKGGKIDEKKLMNFWMPKVSGHQL